MKTSDAPKMTAMNANALAVLGAVFKMNGWSMICRSCGRSLCITDDGRLIEHLPDCTTRVEQHPWLRLRAILNSGAPQA